MDTLKKSLFSQIHTQFKNHGKLERLPADSKLEDQDDKEEVSPPFKIVPLDFNFSDTVE